MDMTPAASNAEGVAALCHTALPPDILALANIHLSTAVREESGAQHVAMLGLVQSRVAKGLRAQVSV